MDCLQCLSQRLWDHPAPGNLGFPWEKAEPCSAHPILQPVPHTVSRGLAGAAEEIQLFLLLSLNCRIIPLGAPGVSGLGIPGLLLQVLFPKHRFIIPPFSFLLLGCLSPFLKPSLSLVVCRDASNKGLPSSSGGALEVHRIFRLAKSKPLKTQEFPVLMLLLLAQHWVMSGCPRFLFSPDTSRLALGPSLSLVSHH